MHYLVPTGQAGADHLGSVILNETGVFLWQLLSEERSTGELADLFIREYDQDPERREEIAEVIAEYIYALSSKGAIISSGPTTPPITHLTIDIGGVKVSFSGSTNLIGDDVKGFATETTGEADLHIAILQNAFTRGPVDGTMLIVRPNLSVFETEKGYTVFLYENRHVGEIRISRDFKQAVIAFRPAPDNTLLSDEVSTAIRMPFMLAALKKGMLYIHSTSVLYKDRAYLFSAAAGTGKSTHATLWKECFGVDQINGDTNLLRIDGDRITVVGTPWCGTSDIRSAEDYPLGGIIFLKRDQSDFTEEFTGGASLPALLARCITPSWTGEMEEMIISSARQIADRSMLLRLHCTKEPSAARVMKDYIDRHL